MRSSVKSVRICFVEDQVVEGLVWVVAELEKDFEDIDERLKLAPGPTRSRSSGASGAARSRAGPPEAGAVGGIDAARGAPRGLPEHTAASGLRLCDLQRGALRLAGAGLAASSTSASSGAVGVPLQRFGRPLRDRGLRGRRRRRLERWGGGGGARRLWSGSAGGPRPLRRARGSSVSKAEAASNSGNKTCSPRAAVVFTNASGSSNKLWRALGATRGVLGGSGPGQAPRGAFRLSGDSSAKPGNEAQPGVRKSARSERLDGHSFQGPGRPGVRSPQAGHGRGCGGAPRGRGEGGGGRRPGRGSASPGGCTESGL